MTTQEEAFREYYASMTDAELLRIAANKISFVDIAQKVLADELVKRNLIVPLGEPSRPIESPRLTVRFAERGLAIKSALLSWRTKLAPKK